MRKGQKVARENRRKLSIEERERAVFELWTSDDRIGFREVGAAFGISHEQARTDLNNFRTKLEADDTRTLENWKQKQLARLNRKYVRLEAIASGEALKRRRIPTAKKVELQLKAEAEQIKVLKEIADVTGIKAAQKHEHTGPGGGPIKTEMSYDLSNLSDEELITLKTIQGKLADAV